GEGVAGINEALYQLRLSTGFGEAAAGFFHKARAAAGNVDQFADQVCVDPVGEVFQVQVQVIHIGGQFGSKVVAQIFRVQVFQIGAGLDEGAPGLGHVLAVDRYKTMGIDRCAERRVRSEGKHT